MRENRRKSGGAAKSIKSKEVLLNLCRKCAILSINRKEEQPLKQKTQKIFRKDPLVLVGALVLAFAWVAGIQYISGRIDGVAS